MRKLSGSVEVPLDGSLLQDIMQWSRGYREMLAKKPKGK